jgi:hypothetical protein
MRRKAAGAKEREQAFAQFVVEQLVDPCLPEVEKRIRYGELAAKAKTSLKNLRESAASSVRNVQSRAASRGR